MRRFDRVIIADWSASNAPSPARPSADAIWIGVFDSAGGRASYHRTRHSAEAALRDHIALGDRLLIGCDFPMAYPVGFARALTGRAEVRDIWAAWARDITDSANNANNRFQVADGVNARFGNGPFWGRPAGLHLPHLPATKRVDYAHLPFAERRAVEILLPRAQTVWKLFTTGAAGSQALMGLPMIHRLSQIPDVSVWPFDQADSRVVLAEVYPSLLPLPADPIKDRAQVLTLARALFLAQNAAMFQPHTTANFREEGWILGADQRAELAAL